MIGDLLVRAELGTQPAEGDDRSSAANASVRSVGCESQRMVMPRVASLAAYTPRRTVPADAEALMRRFVSASVALRCTRAAVDGRNQGFFVLTLQLARTYHEVRTARAYTN